MKSRNDGKGTSTNHTPHRPYGDSIEEDSGAHVLPKHTCTISEH